MNRTLAGFIKKELLQALRDPRMKILLFVMPVVQLGLFGIAISTEVKNLRLAAAFDSRDEATREIVERAYAGGWFIPAGAHARGTGPFELIRAGVADAVLVPPPGGFTKALERGDARLQLLVDASNVLQAQAAEAYLRPIVQRTVSERFGLAPSAPPIRFDVRVLFNPSLDTTIFMVPGVMVIVMLLTTMVLTMISIVREKELGTFEMLISAPVAKHEVIFGKTLPYVLIGMANLPLILAVAHFAFGVPMRGNLLVLFGAAFAFVCTTVAMGTLISTFCANQQQANMAGFLFNFPAIMFSGILFPIENMPEAMRWLAFVDPLSHFLGLLRNIMLKGGDAAFVFEHVAVLVVMAVVSVTVSFRRFHTTLG